MKIPKKALFLPLAIALLAAGCSGGNNVQTSTHPAAPTSKAAQPNKGTATVPPPNPTVSVLAQTAKSVDTQGNPVNPTSIFSTSDAKIYVVVKLQNPKKNDVVSVVRYYKGKFVKANSMRIASDKVKNAVFKFAKNTGYPKGDYTVKVFYNKKSLTSVSYTVK